MKLDSQSLLLYAVTDRTWNKNNSLSEQVEKCLKGGVTLLQLREKHLDYETFLSEAQNIKKLCKKYRIPFIINDNVDIAIACNADGIHVGQEDTPADIIRSKIGNKILGVSVKTVEEALLAEKNGADYLGVGAVFPTSVKPDAIIITYSTLKDICQAVSIPVVAIGGISANNIRQLKGTGIDGVAVVAGIFGQPDITKATRNMLKLTQEIVIGGNS
ncbi:thiamine-phosphate pyrophosphorylase [Brevinema andersonii]|uniref:Thiamine-phosphate synthase n=1 Tax=Brevinema andersonii TaxID=34097 RepID=A0A1I1EZH4_BREAD|nr:thiamine phosphate synthase [Brevinema andersonii]SFB90908.1 thiamine-phosphate pyrophosphorylase [Brevinema andersonii]